MNNHILHFECFAGISGDMCLAALLTLGVPEAHLRQELAKLGIEDEYELQISASQKHGIHGLRVDVNVVGQAHHHDHDHDHDHQHEHDHHHEHAHQRDYRRIRDMIGQSSLSQPVQQRALKIFETVALAEAKIHAMPVETVHFHEVGATDSIVDIVGAAIGIEYLIAEKGVTRIICSALELGSGQVKCAHGTYPVPAPATAEILQGVPFSRGAVDGEATTPTGAAILKACVDEFVDQVQGVSLETVYGIGHRDADIPNVLRVQLIAPKAQQDATQFAHVKIEANIDDMSPEAFEPLVARLFEAGASDVFMQPIMMKKSRPAQMVSILCKKDIATQLGEIVLNHSSTIGLRMTPFGKMVLSRHMVSVPTSLGNVSAKVVIQPDGARRFKSEHDEIASLAQQTGESYLSVKRRIDGEIEAFLATHRLEEVS